MDIIKLNKTLVRFYHKVKKPVAIVYVIAFAAAMILSIIGKESKVLEVIWIALASAMILFAFIAGVMHILVGRKLLKEAKVLEFQLLALSQYNKWKAESDNIYSLMLWAYLQGQNGETMTWEEFGEYWESKNIHRENKEL